MTTSEAREFGDQCREYCRRKDTTFRHNGQAISKVHERYVALENASLFHHKNAGELLKESVWSDRINILHRTNI